MRPVSSDLYNKSDRQTNENRNCVCLFNQKQTLARLRRPHRAHAHTALGRPAARSAVQRERRAARGGAVSTGTHPTTRSSVCCALCCAPGTPRRAGRSRVWRYTPQHAVKFLLRSLLRACNTAPRRAESCLQVYTPARGQVFAATPARERTLRCFSAQVPAVTSAHSDDDAVYITRAPCDSALSPDVVFVRGSHRAFADLLRTVRILGTPWPDAVAERPVLEQLLPAPDAPWSARMHARLRSECPREAPLQAALCWLVDRVLAGHAVRAGALEAVCDCGYLCGHLGDQSMPAEAHVWDELDMAKKAAERGLHVRFRAGSGVAEHVCDRGFLLGLECVHWHRSGFAVYGAVQV